MPVRPLTRDQVFMFPPSLDDLIPADHPVRLVADLVESLGPSERQEMGINSAGDPMGAPSYHDILLTEVWVYGFMRGIRSNRGLERACREMVPFMWLTGMQFPDHVSLWRYYDTHRDGMRGLLKRTVRTAVKMGLVDLVLQAVDGTKIKGNATADRTYDEEGLKRLMGRVDEAIEELEVQCVADENSSQGELPAELCDERRRREEIEKALEQVRAEEGRKRINLTDPDTRLVKGRQGLVAGYNAQAMVSPLKAEYGGGLLITAADVTNVADDHGQLVPMIGQAEENTGDRAETTLADGGYHSGKNLEACQREGYAVLMSESQRKAREKPYHKDRFAYDGERDEYECPEGQRLHYAGVKRRKNRPEMRVYRGRGSVCRECPAFGECTKDRRQGRAIEVGPHEKELRAHRELMSQQESQDLYKRRKETVEPVFGTLKEVQGARQFLLRGLRKVTGEWFLLATAFNLRSLWRSWVRLRTRWSWTG